MVTGFQQILSGGISLPADSQTGEALDTLDRTLSKLMDFCEEILTVNLGAYFAMVCEAEGIEIEGNPDRNIVTVTVATDPTPWLLQTGFKFPLLAVHRVGGKFKPYTKAQVARTESMLVIDFIMPQPKDIQEKIVFESFLSKGYALLASKLEVGIRADGTDWQDGYCLAEELTIGPHQYDFLVPNATASQDKQPFFPALSMNVTLTESTTFDPSEFPALNQIATAITNED